VLQVEKVKAATALVKEARSDLLVEGEPLRVRVRVPALLLLG
jgi:hypothetical protein